MAKWFETGSVSNEKTVKCRKTNKKTRQVERREEGAVARLKSKYKFQMKQVATRGQKQLATFSATSFHNGRKPICTCFHLVFFFFQNLSEKSLFSLPLSLVCHAHCCLAGLSLRAPLAWRPLSKPRCKNIFDFFDSATAQVG